MPQHRSHDLGKSRPNPFTAQMKTSFFKAKTPSRREPSITISQSTVMLHSRKMCGGALVLYMTKHSTKGQLSTHFNRLEGVLESAKRSRAASSKIRDIFFLPRSTLTRGGVIPPSQCSGRCYENKKVFLIRLQLLAFCATISSCTTVHKKRK